MEVRTIGTELRATDAMKIGGVAVPWGSLSVDLGGFREQFTRGAFNETLSDPAADVILLWAHDRTKPIASRASGNLDIRDAAGGLEFDGRLNGTSWAKDAHAAISGGTVRTVSFAFQVQEGGDTWTKTTGGLVRTVHKA